MPDEQTRLFGLPPVLLGQPDPTPEPWPAWFAGDANCTPATHRDRVRRGLHPLGARLAAEGHPGHGHACRDCAHSALLGHHDRAFHKCDLIRRTHGPGTDLRLKWAACIRWEAR